MNADCAVTGLAWSTPLGDDLEGVWRRLLASETGFGKLPLKARVRNHLAALVPGVPWGLEPAERLRRIGHATILRAVTSAHREIDEPGLLLVVGTSLGSFLDDDPPQPDLHAWADDLARGLGLVNPPVVVSTACCSGSDAILIGAELVRSGAAACCVCGGVDVVSPRKMETHSALGTMSPTALRAFDSRHDGMLLGEGAAFMMLEPAAPDREPLAWMLGGGSANDATGMTIPDPDGRGARLAIEQSLASAGLAPEQISVISAHASGTVLNDETECRTYRHVFGEAAAPVVFGTKGNFGHSLGATGAIEAITVIQALRKKAAPPIAGLEQPLPGFPLPLARENATPVSGRHGLDVTLGFGGFNTSLVFGAAI